MKCMNNKALLFFISTVAVLICIASWNARAATLICADSKHILNNLESRFGEVMVERGIDEQLLVVVTANPTANWSMLVTPKGKPNHFCILATGSYWTQDKHSSKGVARNGDVITIIVHEENESWQMLYLNRGTAQITQIATGSHWERLIYLNKNHNNGKSL